ncbi:MAG: hypothetical protein WDW38_006507 [Sanguina aurantia]
MIADRSFSHCAQSASRLRPDRRSRRRLLRLHHCLRRRNAAFVSGFHARAKAPVAGDKQAGIGVRQTCLAQRLRRQRVAPARAPRVRARHRAIAASRAAIAIAQVGGARSSVRAERRRASPRRRVGRRKLEIRALAPSAPACASRRATHAPVDAPRGGAARARSSAREARVRRARRASARARASRAPLLETPCVEVDPQWLAEADHQGPAWRHRAPRAG